MSFDGPMFNKPPVHQVSDDDSISVFDKPNMRFGDGMREAFGLFRESHSGRDEMVNFAAQAAGLVLSRRPDLMDEMDHYAHITQSA
ncbi:MAG: hypothetical protein KGS72_06715 [Cyanobacteria bacterium REEB67]|nr:hypothetical protein [Cyanobacteria bacterium REEB67]